MSKVAYYLQEHLVGEVMTSADARLYFSTDSSIFKITPSIVIYPRNENDVRKTARFTWQLAERGRVVPITARGLGSDQGGAALGSGIMMVFPAHMNKILEFEPRGGMVKIQPGINYDKLQQTLHTHGRFLPPFPSSIQYSTVGGAIANNASGEKTVKYGSTRQYIKSLRVVLSNGEVIETGRLSKRDLNKKLGLTSYEGEIYRQIDTLLEENKELINKTHDSQKVTKNSAGYYLYDLKRKDGSLDLTALFVGSQGTLGIITEAIIETEGFNPSTTLLVGFFDDVDKAGQATSEIRSLNPSTIEVVDINLLDFVFERNPNQLKGIVDKPFPKVIVLTEFDDMSDRTQKRLTKKARKILNKYATEVKITKEPDEQAKLWKIRHSAAAVMWEIDGTKKAIPIVEDGIVPPEKFAEFLQRVYLLFEKYGLKAAVWGHAGNANLHMQPFLDLGQVGDRQKIFKLMDEYYKMVIEMGGSTAGEHNDGRLRAPYLKALYGEEMYELFGKVKKIFDPFNTMNPGVKLDVKVDDLKPILRSEYSVGHLYDHMPRT